MIVGVVGAPNKGKSTFFSAATKTDVAMADYPFTTIDPNKGVGYCRVKCPHAEIGKECKPRTGSCSNGTRLVPVNIIDVAGLVPGAHEGKGMGNRFLDDLSDADALIQVVDASGGTDLEGNKAQGANPIDEVRFLEEELDYWFEGIIKRNYAGKIKGKGAKELYTAVSGLKVTMSDCEAAARAAEADMKNIMWDDWQIFKFARELRKTSKPVLIVANKADLPGAKENIEKLVAAFGADRVVQCSAVAELALRKAVAAGAIKYFPGDDSFEIIRADERQRAGLEAVAAMIKGKGSGVQQAIEKAVFGLLGMIAVFPVEDENNYADRNGNVLPDAILLPTGSSALDLAGKIHTDLAQNFICGINARTHMRVGKETPLKNGDVIKIVSGKNH
ncbi:MAG: redox-regulated ATPase YchF [Candidatus Micrarchaeia archaeon]